MAQVGSSPPLRQLVLWPHLAGWKRTALAPAAGEAGALFLLAALCAVLFLHGLTVGELFRTETLRAIIAAEFLESGDWLVPTLYGEPLLTKPPVMYAAIAAASAPLGEVTEWSARLPSALAATGVVFLMYWYMRRQLGRAAGLVVAAIIPCGPLWLDKATAAEIDMLQVAWVAGALLCFFRATEATDPRLATPPTAGGRRPTAVGWWLAALVCVAGGFLTKWTAPAFFYCAAVPFLAWRRQLRLLVSWPHLAAVGLAAAVGLGWVAAVVSRVGWDTFAQTVWVEAAPRLFPTHHTGNHTPSQPHLVETLTHPLKLLLANLPFSACALVTVAPGFLRLWDERGRRLVQGFHCWAWPNLLLWTILPDHATRHSFPLFPGLVALGAMTWVAFVTGRLSPRWERWHALAGWWTLAGLAGGLVVLVGALCLLLTGLVTAGPLVRAGRYLPPEIWWLAPAAAGVGFWAAWQGWRGVRLGRPAQLLACLVLGWVLLKLVFVHAYVPVRNGGREPRAKAETLARHVPEGQTLYVNLLKDEGIMFYYRRPVRRVVSWDRLPVGSEPVFCIMTRLEWDLVRGRSDWSPVLVEELQDAQGAPIVLVALVRGDPPIRSARRATQPPDRQRPSECQWAVTSFPT